MSNLIDIDLREYEPEEDPDEEPQTLPHPPGPAGLCVPRTRLWIKRPPGPAGL